MQGDASETAGAAVLCVCTSESGGESPVWCSELRFVADGKALQHHEERSIGMPRLCGYARAEKGRGEREDGGAEKHDASVLFLDHEPEDRGQTSCFDCLFSALR